jgi:hypothetical protein
MKAKIIGVLMLGCSILLSCNHTSESKCGPCPLILQLAPFVNVRIVDKTTGDDLFLSPGSPYKFSDLKMISAQNDFRVTIDSTQKDNRFIRILIPQTETLNIKLGNLSADSVRVVFKNDSPKCCPITKISKIILDNTPICNPCTLNAMVTIKK